MSVNVVDYILSTNEDWLDTIVLLTGEQDTPVDLTGSSFQAQLRVPAEALHIALECSTANGRLEIADPSAAGMIAWNVPASILRTVPAGSYAYDIVWTNAGGVRDRFVQGTITLQRGVTRP